MLRRKKKKQKKTFSPGLQLQPKPVTESGTACAAARIYQHLSIKTKTVFRCIFVTFFWVISVHLFSPLILNQTKKNNKTLWGTRFYRALISNQMRAERWLLHNSHTRLSTMHPWNGALADRFVSTFRRLSLSRRIVSIRLLERRCLQALYKCI